MKRMGFVWLLITSLVLSGTNASAATKPDIVLKGFQSYVASAKSALSNNKKKYDATEAAINADYAYSKSLAKLLYDKEILEAKNLYEPQIIIATQIIRDAKAKFLTVSQVRVLKQGNNRNNWGYLNCPITRTDCKSVDKGELFVIGEVTTLKSVVAENFDYISGVQSIIDEGLIELLNPVEYQKVIFEIKTEPGKIRALTTQWDTANSAASYKQKTTELFSSLNSNGPLMVFMENFEANQDLLENQVAAGNMAIRAAKRAMKNPSVFDKAFVTAFKFEYNVKGLDDIANLSFSSLNTLRSYLSQFAIIELADKALGVNTSYNYLAAEKINKSVGNVFTSDEEFQKPAKLVAAQYKKLTKISLKF
jgi:hypothetical protein